MDLIASLDAALTRANEERSKPRDLAAQLRSIFDACEDRVHSPVLVQTENASVRIQRVDGEERILELDSRGAWELMLADGEVRDPWRIAVLLSGWLKTPRA